MTETSTASAPDVDAFLSGFGVSLAHFGVKGMKWGVRKNPGLVSDIKVLSGNQKEIAKRRSVDPSKDPKVIREQKADEKRYQKKVAATTKSAHSDAKETAKKVALVAVKYGAPSAAVAAGAAVGLPAVAAFGISVKALQEPAVQEAIAVGARYTKSLVSDMGDISVPKINLPNPNFGTKTVSSRDISRELADSKRPVARVQVGDHIVKVPVDQAKFFLKQSNDMHDLED
jgi:hypothetical protein